MDLKRMIPAAFFIIMLSIVILWGADSETKKIMPFVDSSSNIYCSSCHQGDPKMNFPIQKKACETYCVTCHKDMKDHHPTDVGVEGNIPAAMALKKNGKVTCFTCHDLNGMRYSNKSYRSESLFEGMFRIKKKYKTYYLIMRNNNGQLCKKCH